MIKVYAAAAAVAAIAGLSTAWFLGRGGSDFAQCSATQVAGDIGGPFELVNQSGETVTDAEVFQEPSLVYFGYTYCPDICPFDVARNAEAVDILAERGLSTTPVFITIDPERDTVDVVNDYAYNMHEKMIALTGSEDQVAAASKAYKTYYKAHKDGTDEYLVDHSSFTYLVFPERGFVEFFRNSLSAQDVAERTACFVANA